MCKTWRIYYKVSEELSSSIEVTTYEDRLLWYSFLYRIAASFTPLLASVLSVFLHVDLPHIYCGFPSEGLCPWKTRHRNSLGHCRIVQVLRFSSRITIGWLAKNSSHPTFLMKCKVYDIVPKGLTLRAPKFLSLYYHIVLKTYISGMFMLAECLIWLKWFIILNLEI